MCTFCKVQNYQMGSKWVSWFLKAIPLIFLIFK